MFMVIAFAMTMIMISFRGRKARAHRANAVRRTTHRSRARGGIFELKYDGYNTPYRHHRLQLV